MENITESYKNDKDVLALVAILSDYKMMSDFIIREFLEKAKEISRFAKGSYDYELKDIYDAYLELRLSEKKGWKEADWLDWLENNWPLQESNSNTSTLKHVKLFEEFLNEDRISISKKEMEKLHSDGEVEVGDHTVVFEEGTVNEAKSVDRDKMMNWISKTMNVAGTSEEFDGSPDGIWLCGECGDEYKGKRIYDYYSEDHKNRTFGALNSWEKELNKRGWYSNWYDAGTVMVRPD